MSDALRYEWTRIRTLRSTYWLLGLTLAIPAGVALILGLAVDESDRGPEMVLGVLTGGTNFMSPLIAISAIFLAIIGVFTTGHEYRHGTIQPTLSAIPQRSTLLTAKISVLVLTVLTAIAVSLLLNYAIGIVFWGDLSGVGDPPIDEALLGYIIFVLLYALLGLALGQLFRGVPSALVVLLVTPTIVEQLLTGLAFIEALDWLVPVIKFLPFTAGSRLMATGDPDYGPGAPNFDLFDRWASGGIFAAFVVIVLAVAWYLFKKRDA